MNDKTEEEPPLPGSFAVMTEKADSLTFIAPFYFRLKAGGRGIESWPGVKC